MKKPTALLLVAVMLFALAGCGSAPVENPAAGTYTGVYAIRGEYAVPLGELYDGACSALLRSDSDGSCVLTLGGNKLYGTWSGTEGSFTAVMNTGEKFTGSLQEGILRFTDAATGAELILVDSATAGAAEHAAELIAPYQEAAQQNSAESYLEFWRGNWYGWWVMGYGTGAYADIESAKNWWDVCANITADEDGTANITIWDEDCGETELIADARLFILQEGTQGNGVAYSSGGTFYGCSLTGNTGWTIDPETASFDGEHAVEHLVQINGLFEDANGTLTYAVYLRPWGTVWDDVNESYLPASYERWYLPLIQQGSEMPRTIG